MIEIVLQKKRGCLNIRFEAASFLCFVLYRLSLEWAFGINKPKLGTCV